MAGMAAVSNPGPGSGVVAAALPVAAAIGVFGLVYGAVARPVIGPLWAVVSSLIVFSGAAQFTMVALVAAGASTAAVVGAVTMLALRHLPLGAILRPRLTAGTGQRALLAWFLIDETTGLAVTLNEAAERTLLVSGGLTYAAWVLGTALGVAGGQVGGVEPLAAALFPVLFVGLAALTATTRSDVVRAVVAGCAALGLLLIWPAAGALGAIVVAVAVAVAVPQP